MRESCLRPNNVHEQRCFDKILGKGYQVMRAGWPDFLVLKPDGSIVCVEVKPNLEIGLSPEQDIVCRALARAGVPVYVWTPLTGFREVSG